MNVALQVYLRLGQQRRRVHIPGGPKSKLLSVLVDLFTGWVEAFTCRTDGAREVVRVLITEITPQFCLPQSLQSDNGPAFKAEVTQGL
jgi:hypothetical protein